MSALTVTAADPGSRARTGLLHTAHGDVRTPAFVPLATKGSVAGSSRARWRGSASTWCSATRSTSCSSPGPS